MSTALSISELPAAWDSSREGSALFEIVSGLFPLCRSITGDGLRESLRRIRAVVPLELHEVPSGTKVFDWTVPNEWSIRDAWIKNARGERLVDFQKSNLHVVNYSVAVRRRMALAELKPFLHTLPATPDWIPYRTSYYKETWGFCLTERQLQALPDEELEVVIDSTIAPGSLTYGEFLVKGATAHEVLISCHSCHPSLANDNLSGMAVAAQLAKKLSTLPLRYSYRFVWAPGTVGAITWLALNEARLRNVRHGLVLSCVGDPGRFTYKRTRDGKAPIDRAIQHVLKHAAPDHELLDFSPLGYDERQYGSPGINLPVGCFMRTPNGRYPQYHTSADNLDFVRPDALAESLRNLLLVVEVLEGNRRYVNLNPKCEPQLGRRGLYRQMGGTHSPESEAAILWVLNFSDGAHALLDIAEKSNLPFTVIAQAARRLLEHGLLQPSETNGEMTGEIGFHTAADHRPGLKL